MNRKALSARWAASSRSTRSRRRIRLLFSRYSFSPERYRRRPSSSTWYSTGRRPSPLSRTRVTSAIPCAARFSEPAQMTSSALRERSARPCSPSAQRNASARLLLPEPFGPTTALIPGPNSTFVRSANDLNPCRRRARRRGSVRRSSSITRSHHPVRSFEVAPSPVRQPPSQLCAERGLHRSREVRRRPRLRSGTTSRGPDRSCR